MVAPPLSLRGVYDALRVPTLRDLVFSAKAYLAMVLALLVGFSQDLENPYWSVLTIYIVLTPPEAGAIRSKALFRLIGTIGGGLLMLAVTGLFGDQLGILVTATIAILGVALFLRQIDRTPTSYIWFSGGVTAGVVGLTNLMQPVQMFDYATARIGEISVGILAITAIDSLLWPRPMTPEFLHRLEDWQGQARGWLVEALGLAAAQAPEEERRMAVRQGLRDLTKAVGDIDARAVQLPFDVVPMAPRGRHLNLVRRQIVEVIADLSGIEFWARALRRNGRLHADLGQAIAAVSDWVQGDPVAPGPAAPDRAASAQALIDQLLALRAGLDPREGHVALVERGLLTRLASFLQDWSDLELALCAVAQGVRLPARLEGLAARCKPVRSVDHVGALLDVAPMLLSTGFTAAFWYLSAWSGGAGALLFSFIGCVFLIGQSAILRAGGGLLVWIMTAFVLVFLYQFAVLPRVTDFPVLVAVLGCALLPFGLLMTMSMAGMLVCVYVFAFLGLQGTYAGDFNASLQSLSSSMVGLLVAIACLHVCAYDHARFASRRLVTAVRRDIIDVARGRRMPPRERFLFLTIDRLALYFPAAEALAAGGPLPRLHMLDDFAVGVNLLALRGHERQVWPAMGETIAGLRADITDLLRERLAGRPGSEVPTLTRIDAALADPDTLAQPDGAVLAEALTGLRLALTDRPGPGPGPGEGPR
jgi:uncharacterized membrane protein YccC